MSSGNGALRLAAVAAPATTAGPGALMTVEEVRELLRLPSVDAARRLIARCLPADVRAQGVGRRLLVVRSKLERHLGIA